MSDEKAKKRKNAPSLNREGRGGTPKEHKRPWQETMATPQEIKAMLSERVLLRYNEVRGRTEIHWLSQGPVIGEDEQGHSSVNGYLSCFHVKKCCYKHWGVYIFLN